MDLWLVVSRQLTRPVPADPAAITDAEIDRESRWVSVNTCACGFLVLSINHNIMQKVVLIPGLAPGTEATTAELWTNATDLYGTLSPSQLFDIYKQLIHFWIAAHLLPMP